MTYSHILCASSRRVTLEAAAAYIRDLQPGGAARWWDWGETVSIQLFNVRFTEREELQRISINVKMWISSFDIFLELLIINIGYKTRSSGVYIFLRWKINKHWIEQIHSYIQLHHRSCQKKTPQTCL